jgi:hypothetical protein
MKRNVALRLIAHWKNVADFARESAVHNLHYCRSIPLTIPAGRVLVHNHVVPMPILGLNGFRAWTQVMNERLELCHCKFGGCRDAELHNHYRVKRLIAGRRLPKSHEAQGLLRHH